MVHQADEVIVVDSGSRGGEAARIARLSGAHVVALKRNVGLANGMNVGVAATSGDVVAFLNDDAVAGAGWLDTAAARLEDATLAAIAPKVVLAGRYLEVILDDEPYWVAGDSRPLGRRLESATLSGRDVLGELVGAGVHALETPAPHGSDANCPRWRWTAGRVPFYLLLPEGDGNVSLELNGEPIRPRRVVDLMNTAGCYLRKDGAVGDIGADAPDDERFDVAEERFSLSGVAFVTTREMLHRVGRFESRYFATYEDADWCWRARLMGLRLVYEPSVQVRHVRGATTSWVPAPLLRSLAERNRVLTLVRNAPVTVAAREALRLRANGSGSLVAVARMAPRALVGRMARRSRHLLTPTEVFERWAGVDVPPQAVPAGA